MDLAEPPVVLAEPPGVRFRPGAPLVAALPISMLLLGVSISKGPDWKVVDVRTNVLEREGEA